MSSLQDPFPGSAPSAETLDAPIGALLAAPPHIARPFTAVLTPGSGCAVEILAATRDALDLAVDVQEFRPKLVLLSPEIRNYTPDLVEQFVNWPEFPIAVVGLVPSAGAWGAEMAANGAIAFYNTPITPAVVDQFVREAPQIVERARTAWRAPAVKTGVSRSLLDAVGATSYQTGALAFWSTKGGDGKTTLAAEVACILSQVAGRRVLLVDGNMNGGHVALHLSISPERNNLMHLASEYQTAGNRLTGDMLKRRVVGADAYLDPRTRVTESRLSVLLGITNIRQASSPELAGRQGEQFTADLVRLARELYDFVLIDLGSTINAGVHVGALRSADIVIFISSDDRSSLYFNRNVFETLVEQSSLRTDKFKLVINGYQAESGLALDEIARYMEMLVFATVPHDPTGSVKLAINNGQSYALTHLDIRNNSLEVEATLRGMFAIAEGVYPPLSAILAARDQNLNGHRPPWWKRVFGGQAPNGAKRR